MGDVTPLMPTEKFVPVLEHALEEAKAGNLRGIAIVLLPKLGDPACAFGHENPRCGLEVEGACHRLLQVVNTRLQTG